MTTLDVAPAVEAGKFCRACRCDKPRAEFYTIRGKYPSALCRPCTRAAVKANREKMADYYKAFDRKRANDPERVAAREAYAKTEAGKEAIKRAHRRQKERSPEKISARNRLYAAVRDGKMAKPDACQVCGDAGTIEAHHHDYGKPLDVHWLCRPCHVAEHKAVLTTF